MVFLKEFSIEQCDDRLLIKHLCDYILKNNQRYLDDGFIIWIGEYYLRIKYNHHIYKVTIIKEQEDISWYLKPYNKKYYTTSCDRENSFEFVIMAIKENDKILNLKK